MKTFADSVANPPNLYSNFLYLFYILFIRAWKCFGNHCNFVTILQCNAIFKKKKIFFEIFVKVVALHL